MPFEGPTSEVINAGGEEIKDPVKASVPVVNKSVVITSPDVLPQFPGGVKELIKFLKRNLSAPHQLEENEEIGVKVKFIVSYNGDLLSFDVIETGGEAFDNEVIRVLKKMPKWIPGKFSGENVSTFYIIPVKFRPSD